MHGRTTVHTLLMESVVNRWSVADHRRHSQNGLFDDKKLETKAREETWL
jgi:hypothetical protein